MHETDLGQVITFNPLVVCLTTTLDEMLCQWSADNFHHWPVVDDDGHLQGIVSEQDIHRVVAEICSSQPDSTPIPLHQLRRYTAGQIMSNCVISISRWDSQSNGLFLLLKNHVHSLPVMDEERLVGLVTTTDYLREFSYAAMSVSRQPVADFVQDTVDPIDCDLSLAAAEKAMQLAGVEQIGLINGALPVGAVTSRDIASAKCRVEICNRLGGDLQIAGPKTLRELVAKSPTIPPGARLCEAARLMVEHHRKAIAVVTQAGRMVGVVSEATILRAMAGKSQLALARA